MPNPPVFDNSVNTLQQQGIADLGRGLDWTSDRANFAADSFRLQTDCTKRWSKSNQAATSCQHCHTWSLPGIKRNAVPKLKRTTMKMTGKLELKPVHRNHQPLVFRHLPIYRLCSCQLRIQARMALIQHWRPSRRQGERKNRPGRQESPQMKDK